MAKRPVTVNDLLAGHVGLDIECAHRVYLNGYVPTLQQPGQIVGFLTRHLGQPIPSPALMDQIGQRFRHAVDTYTQANRIPAVRFGEGLIQIQIGQVEEAVSIRCHTPHQYHSLLAWSENHMITPSAR